MQLQTIQSIKCKEYYEAVYCQTSQKLEKTLALDEVFQHFFDQRPGSKSSKKDRALGLACANFWCDSSAVNTSKYASLALNHILKFDDAISIVLLEYLAIHSADMLRWAIRYSKLFTRTNSPLWLMFRSRVNDQEWAIFFGVCDRLLNQLEPFDEMIKEAELTLSKLSLFELLLYLSLDAYKALVTGDGNDPGGKRWSVQQRIIERKLLIATEQDFSLSEQRLAESIREHLMPFLLPPSSQTPPKKLKYLSTIEELVYATQERMDYEESIDWFCFGEECGYQLEPFKSVIFDTSDAYSKDWDRTDLKFRAMNQHYWMTQGLMDFLNSKLNDLEVLGSVKNHEKNRETWIRVSRAGAQLHEVFGFDEEIELTKGRKLRLFDCLLCNEFHTSFFQQDFIEQFKTHYGHTGDVYTALGLLMMNGLMTGENRFPLTWILEDDKAHKIANWFKTEAYPSGDALVAKDVLQFWSNDLSALSATIKANPNQPMPRLNEKPFLKIGRFLFQMPWVFGRQDNMISLANNLRRVQVRRSGLLEETRQIELRLADLFKARGFSVVVGYRPEKSEDNDPGEVDLICYLDGVLLVVEVKSSYVRTKRSEIWLHKTSTLRKAAWQLRRKRSAIQTALTKDEELHTQLGLDRSLDQIKIESWIVDTSIECDQVLIDGFLVVSLESLIVILKDQPQFLNDKWMTNQDEEKPVPTLFDGGFSPSKLIEVVRKGYLWNFL